MRASILVMGVAVPAIFAASAIFAIPVSAQGANPQPSCNRCEGVYVPAEEIQAYLAKERKENAVDLQDRNIDIGKVRVALGVVHRGKLDKPAPHSAAEHDLVSEVYHIISGEATLVLGPDLVDKKRRPPDAETVRLMNGPGNNGDTIRGGKTYHLKAGDVVFVPAGTGHWFTQVPDHIDYIMVRVDPDKVTPVKDEAASKAFLGSYYKK